MNPKGFGFGAFNKPVNLWYARCVYQIRTVKRRTCAIYCMYPTIMIGDPPVIQQGKPKYRWGHSDL